MGCTAGKMSMKSSNNQLDSTDIKKKNSANLGYMRYSQHSNQGSGGRPANPNCISEFGLQRNKRGTLQVDFINDPNQMDQITAKITRNSPMTTKKRSIDQESWSPNMEKLKLQRIKQQQVGTVQEKSECEEQGTHHNLCNVIKPEQTNLHQYALQNQRSTNPTSNNNSIHTSPHQIILQV